MSELIIDEPTARCLVEKFPNEAIYITTHKVNTILEPRQGSCKNDVYKFTLRVTLPIMGDIKMCIEVAPS